MLTETKRVMVAVDDDAARTALIENLEADGYQPIAALTLEHAGACLSHNLDALIVDLGASTTSLIDTVRGGEHSVDEWLPILAGTASRDLFYPVRLLERGADDVIYEPWFYIEVRARLAALLRRADAAHSRQLLRAGRLRVDVGGRRAWIGEVQIKLTSREFDLLRVLVSEPDRVFTRDELLATVWGLGDWARTRTLDSHAARLRQRLNAAGGSWVRNVWGVGYRLTDTGVAPT
jgi:DNA-binding response OmpR family regulator